LPFAINAGTFSYFDNLHLLSSSSSSSIGVRTCLLDLRSRFANSIGLLIEQTLSVCAGSGSGFDDAAGAVVGLSTVFFPPVPTTFCFFLASSRAVFSASAISFSTAARLLQSWRSEARDQRPVPQLCRLHRAAS
jgi:hypothetical protein